MQKYLQNPLKQKDKKKLNPNLSWESLFFFLYFNLVATFSCFRKDGKYFSVYYDFLVCVYEVLHTNETKSVYTYD